MTKMLKSSYDEAIDTYMVHFGASNISGRRTVAHSKSVGGFAGDPHVGGFGTDVLYDLVPAIEDAQAFASTLGLTVLREHHLNGDHLQPSDWVND